MFQQHFPLVSFAGSVQRKNLSLHSMTMFSAESRDFSYDFTSTFAQQGESWGVF